LLILFNVLRNGTTKFVPIGLVNPVQLFT